MRFLGLILQILGIMLLITAGAIEFTYQRNAPYYWVAFRGGHEIHRMAVNSGRNISLSDGQTPLPQAERLTHTVAMLNVDPIWSPDGESIIYTANISKTGSIVVNSRISRIARVQANTGQMTWLTRGTVEYRDHSPSISPDGEWIVFVSNRYGAETLYLMRSDGSDLRPLTVPGVDHKHTNPQWSPDGTWIAFNDIRPYDATYTNYYPDEPDIRISALSRIAVIQLDNPDPIYLTDETTQAFAPSWSPDGTQIAFTGYSLPTDIQGNEGETRFYPGNMLYILRLDNRQVSNITDWHSNIISFAWSPDGARIVYLDEDHRRTETLYYYTFSTMKQKRLAYLQTRDIPTLAWSPDGRWVITTCRLSEHNSWADNMYRISVNGDLIQGLTGSSNAIQSPNVGPMVERDLNVIRYVISGILLILIGKLTIPLGEVVRVFTETTRNIPAP